MAERETRIAPDTRETPGFYRRDIVAVRHYAHGLLTGIGISLALGSMAIEDTSGRLTGMAAGSVIAIGAAYGHERDQAKVSPSAIRRRRENGEPIE